MSTEGSHSSTGSSGVREGGGRWTGEDRTEEGKKIPAIIGACWRRRTCEALSYRENDGTQQGGPGGFYRARLPPPTDSLRDNQSLKPGTGSGRPQKPAGF